MNSLISEQLYNVKAVESVSCVLLVGKGCRTLDNFVSCLMGQYFFFFSFLGKAVIQVDVKTLPVETLLLSSIQGLFGY